MYETFLLVIIWWSSVSIRLVIWWMQWWRCREFHWIYIFLTRYSIWSLLARYLTLNKISLSGPEQRNHELRIFERKIVFSSVVDKYQSEIGNGIWATTNVLNLQTQNLREANMTDWLIDLNIFPFLWWRTSLQMSRSVCKINKNYRAVVFHER